MPSIIKLEIWNLEFRKQIDILIFWFFKLVEVVVTIDYAPGFICYASNQQELIDRIVDFFRLWV